MAKEKPKTYSIRGKIEAGRNNFKPQDCEVEVRDVTTRKLVGKAVPDETGAYCIISKKELRVYVVCNPPVPFVPIVVGPYTMAEQLDS